MSDEATKKLCLICGQNPPRSTGWIYLWKGKQGFACTDCGDRFHETGDYLLGAAQASLERNGIKVAQTKEKFGRMVLYTDHTTPEQAVFVKALALLFKGMFPEYEWDFS